jgi:Mrp family chromosome partitioning ATPase
MHKTMQQNGSGPTTPLYAGRVQPVNLDPGAGTRPTEGSLTSYLQAIRTHRLTVAIITIACCAAAVGYLVVHKPSYQATAQILTTPLPETDTTFLGIDMLRDSGDPTRTAQTAAQLVDSPAAQAQTARLVGDGYTQASVSDAVSVNPLGESNVLAVVATATNATVAQRLANDFVQAALQTQNASIHQQVEQRIAELKSSGGGAPGQIAALEAVAQTGNPTLSTAQMATLPTSPSGASKPIVLILALLAGFCVGSIVAVLMERFDPVVRHPEDLVDIYPLPVLTRIPKMNRRQRATVAAEGMLKMPPFVREGYRSVQVQLDPYYMRLREEAEMSRTIMVTSASKGDGKTSSAINLSFALVAAGHRVILMDCDLRKPDCAARLGIPDQGGVVRLLTSDTPLEDLLVPAPDLPPLLVLPAGARSGDVMMLETLNRRLSDILRAADELADYVVVDTAPLGEVTDALRFTDHIDDVIIVGRPGVTDRRRLGLMRDLLDRAGVTPTGMIIVADSSLMAGYSYGREPTRRSAALPD